MPDSNSDPDADSNSDPDADSNSDPDAIVAHLRTLDTEAEGAAYLTKTGAARDHDALVAVAWAAGLTRIEKLSKPKLAARITKQTIGARKKFEGLRKW